MEFKAFSGLYYRELKKKICQSIIVHIQWKCHRFESTDSDTELSYKDLKG